MSRILLVIPHYNDVERLRPFLTDLLNTLPGHFSILVSDDGSLPKQQEQLTQLIAELHAASNLSVAQLLPPLFTPCNTGKGGAVHRGWLHSEGYSRIAFTDADGAVSATEIVRVESFFCSDACEADAVFASRVKLLGRSIHRTFKRHLSGRVFATLVSELTKVPAYDTQCGFKILSIEAYQKIRPYLSTEGFAFDVELLLLLLKSGARVVEFPVDWRDVEGSKVSLARDSLRMAMQVVTIKNRIDALTI